MRERRRPMRRLSDLLPEAAASLGLEEELALARAMASWRRLVQEHVPAAAGATELIGFQSGAVVVSAAAPIVAQELRLHAAELLAAFAGLPGGRRALELRVTVRAAGDRGSERRTRGRIGGRDRGRPGERDVD